ncbi:hypothetical protein CHARACLAT_005977 [Characodon lateralis]|uniref:Uncharacterized protein n=1 Tax=Characodon lateralis TaxID=208331 RepID=A0ABU7DY44_9TELE|nr:hypothetical protein [Characodon lateralis]
MSRESRGITAHLGTIKNLNYNDPKANLTVTEEQKHGGHLTKHKCTQLQETEKREQQDKKGTKTLKQADHNSQLFAAFPAFDTGSVEFQRPKGQNKSTFLNPIGLMLLLCGVSEFSSQLLPSKVSELWSKWSNCFLF